MLWILSLVARSSNESQKTKARILLKPKEPTLNRRIQVCGEGDTVGDVLADERAAFYDSPMSLFLSVSKCGDACEMSVVAPDVRDSILKERERDRERQ